MSVGIECQKKAKQLWQFRISKIRNNRDRNGFGRDHAGMVLPAWNDFWSSLACPRAPPFTPNNRFRLASKFTFPLIFCHQQGYNPTCVPLRELYGQLTKIVAPGGGGGGGSSNIQILPTPPCPPGDVSHVHLMNVDATKIWQMDKTFLTFLVSPNILLRFFR